MEELFYFTFCVSDTFMVELMLKANCTCFGFLTVFSMVILEIAVYFPSLMMVTENFAFMAGSSKHGKAFRANVGSNKVAAKYLAKTSRD